MSLYLQQKQYPQMNGSNIILAVLHQTYAKVYTTFQENSNVRPLLQLKIAIPLFPPHGFFLVTSIKLILLQLRHQDPSKHS